jgi:hypothetical protein
VPYISEDDRFELSLGTQPRTAGELNYAITAMIVEYLEADGGPKYDRGAGVCEAGAVPQDGCSVRRSKAEGERRCLHLNRGTWRAP